MKTLIMFFLFCGICYAEPFVVTKPNILASKILTEQEQTQVKEALTTQGRLLINKYLTPSKNDYTNDFDRGSVEWNPDSHNYAYHKVIIPDGTIIKDTNFSQKEPETSAISGDNLTFINCNLVNVSINPTWEIQSCNTAQIKRIKKTETDLGGGSKEIIISHQVKQKDGTFKEVDIDVETINDADSYSLLLLRLNE